MVLMARVFVAWVEHWHGWSHSPHVTASHGHGQLTITEMIYSVRSYFALHTSVRPSVCLWPDSRTNSCGKAEINGKVTHVTCTSRISYGVKRLKVKLTGLNNAQTKKCYLTFELEAIQTWNLVEMWNAYTAVNDEHSKAEGHSSRSEGQMSRSRDPNRWTQSLQIEPHIMLSIGAVNLVWSGPGGGLFTFGGAAAAASDACRPQMQSTTTCRLPTITLKFLALLCFIMHQHVVCKLWCPFQDSTWMF